MRTLVHAANVAARPDARLSWVIDLNLSAAATLLGPGHCDDDGQFASFMLDKGADPNAAGAGYTALQSGLATVPDVTPPSTAATPVPDSCWRATD